MQAARTAAIHGSLPPPFGPHLLARDQRRGIQPAGDAFRLQVNFLIFLAFLCVQCGYWGHPPHRQGEIYIPESFLLPEFLV